MIPTVVVFVGGGIGAALRHGVNLAAARAFGTGFPWGTAIVNVVGCFAMGLIAGWFAFKAGSSWPEGARLFLTTGILGGFTTFSAFSLDFALLWQRGEPALAAAYAIGSVVLSLVGVFAGLWVVRAAV